MVRLSLLELNEVSVWYKTLLNSSQIFMINSLTLKVNFTITVEIDLKFWYHFSLFLQLYTYVPSYIYFKTFYLKIFLIPNLSTFYQCEGLKCVNLAHWELFSMWLSSQFYCFDACTLRNRFWIFIYVLNEIWEKKIDI